jgi:hypothetical protein
MLSFSKSTRTHWLLRRVAVALAMMACCVCHGQSMPSLEGKTLAGQTIKLPRDTEGKPLVLVFGFERSAKDQALVWGKKLAEWQKQKDDFAFYNVAMLSGAPRFTHGLITRAIRASVPAAGHAHMLLSSTKDDAWRSALNVRNDNIAYVVLCDGDGRINWQTKGAGKEQFDSLLAHLREDGD